MISSPLADALRAADFDHIELVGLDGGDEREFHTGGGIGVVWSRPLEAEGRSRLRALINALPVVKAHDATCLRSGPCSVQAPVRFA